MKNNDYLTKFIYIIVNLLFVAKYSERVLGWWCIAPVILAIIFYLFCFRYAFPFIIQKQRCHKWIFILATCFIGLVIAVQCHLDPYSINVDRWSALQFTIDKLFNGEYIYSITTHLGNYASPFPVLILIHIPFYLLGNVGLSFFVFLALFIFSIYKVQGRTSALICFILIIMSPAALYEALARSDLFGNILLLASLINLTINNINEDWLGKHYVITACIVGLLMSTRIICIIPIGMLLLPYFFKMELKKQLLFALIAISVFILTFVPFVYDYWQLFTDYKTSPWGQQTKQGNITDFILFIPLFCYLGLKWNNTPALYYRNVAIMLIAFIGITFLHNMFLSGQYNLFSLAYDITYFSTAIPFCILSVGQIIFKTKQTTFCVKN